LSPARTRLRVLLVAAVALAVTGTTATVAHAEPSKAELTQKIEKDSEELEDLTESYNKLNEEIKATKAAEAKVNKALAPVQAELSAAGVEVGALAAQAYMQGNVGAANALLTGGGDVVDRIGYLQQLSRNRQRTVDAFNATNAKFLQEQSKLHTARLQQDAQKKELDARKKKIEADVKKLLDLRKDLYGSAEEPDTGGYTGAIPNISGKAGGAVRFAYGAIGIPYRWGGASRSGYDCSGLTLSAWAAAGKSLPHNAAMQYNATARISRSQLRPGDLVFYRGLKHVALYVGDGMIIDAPRTGTRVSKRSINIMAPMGYGRVR
jgi:cell wall-associated NlpC family hydrolase